MTLRQKWDTFGNSLFDVKSDDRAESSDSFDESFYVDQKSGRIMIMFLSKVTKEYVQQEESRKKREALKQRKKKSAYASFDVSTDTDVNTTGVNVDDVETEDSGEDCEESLLKSPLPDQVCNIVTRRSLHAKKETLRLGVQMSKFDKLHSS